jgi:hypothetical protein
MINHVYVCKHIQPYICQLDCDVRVWHGKTRDFIIDGTIYWVRLFEASVFERKMFFYLEIEGKLTGLSNKFEPSMVFDPSEFEAPKFDCI